jgi:hypothetical protein
VAIAISTRQERGNTKTGKIKEYFICGEELVQRDN